MDNATVAKILVEIDRRIEATDRTIQQIARRPAKRFGGGQPKGALSRSEKLEAHHQAQGRHQALVELRRWIIDHRHEQ